MRLLLRTLIAAVGLSMLAACAVEVGASNTEISAVRHVSKERPYVAVVSMVNRGNNRAAHTALIINASQRVIYDPAGTFFYEDLAERGDIHYGATDVMVSYYERYHARLTYYVHVQTIPVTAQVAEAVLRRAQAQGPSPKMFCTVHTTAVLNDVPGFPGAPFRTSFFPETLRAQVAELPGVIDRYRFEEDSGKAVPGS